MSYSSTSDGRRSLCLKDYDYSQAGIYFITLCTHQRMCLFGDIVNGEMLLNSAGEMIDKLWCELPKRFKLIFLDDYVIMPNHLHALLHINADGGKSISQIVQYFKSFSCLKYIQGVKQFSWEDFPGKLWQRNYYEHIVRNEDSLGRIRQYIRCNPQEWSSDKENPKNTTKIC